MHNTTNFASKNDPVLIAAYDFMCACNSTTGNSIIDNLYTCLIDVVSAAISNITGGTTPVCNNNRRPSTSQVLNCIYSCGSSEMIMNSSCANS